MDREGGDGSDLPVAVVAVDTPLPHLDRGFEYAVPAELAAIAWPGVRVKVRFSGRDVDGFVLERRAVAEHSGPLAPLRRVVSPEPVLTPRIAAVARRLADRHAGTLSDVLRLAVPPRHARAERALDVRGAPAAPSWAAAEDPGPAAVQDAAAAPDPSGAWADYPAGGSLLRRLAEGSDASAAWSALPGQPLERDWPAALAAAAAACLSGGRGALLVVPDARDVARLDRALHAALGPEAHVVLTAAQGPQARYTAWLRVLRRHVRCVVGTRAAAFAPVADLGLVAWWDDGDDSHAEPHAPYPHVREVLLAQAELGGASVLAGGFARTAAVQALVTAGRLKEIGAEPGARRAAAPRVHVAGEGLDEERDGPAARAHLPGAAWRAARSGLASGPVLVQVPRRGYLPALSCATCRTPARCLHCAGPLALPGPERGAACRWCGATAAHFACPECGGHRLRSTVVGARRTAEEIGRAFPGVPVTTSGAGHVVAEVSDEPGLVVATPGAEPVAGGGYAAVLLLDAWASLDRPVLDAGEEALRRWLDAAALARPGATIVLAGVPQTAAGTTLPAVEALVRWAPEWFAGRELAERAALRLPPAAWVASLRGSRRGLRDLLAAAGLPEDVERLGPLPVPGSDLVHLLVRAPIEQGPTLAAALAAARAIRSARKEQDHIQVKIGIVDA